MMIRNALKWKNVAETRGRKIKKHEGRIIKRPAADDSFVTSHHIKEDLNLDFSSRTVRRWLVKKKSLFEKKARGNKFAFCKNACRLAWFKMA